MSTFREIARKHAEALLDRKDWTGRREDDLKIIENAFVAALQEKLTEVKTSKALTEVFPTTGVAGLTPINWR
jgi:hypothetical protein